MKTSWKIGTFAGIGVYIHPTFLILVLWILFVYWNVGHNLATVAGGLIFTLALFFCVVLHEFGHALTAKRYGIKTRDITLLPIGGVSRLERIPEEPLLEFHVAVMGPIVSLAIAAILFLLLKLGGQSITLEQLNSWTSASLVTRLMFANVLLAVFNLLPAFPMDGGRIFRALLARYVGFTRATRVAAKVGHAVAILFGLVGLYSNPFLVLIAVFIWIGASQEQAMAQMKWAFAGVPISQVTITDITPIAASDPLSHAVELVVHGTQQDFPVVEDGRLVGILTNKELLRGLSQSGPDTPVADVMMRDVRSVNADDVLQSAMEQLQNSGTRVLPVVDHEQFLGFLTLDNLAEFLMLQSALHQDGRAFPTDGHPIHRHGNQERWPRRIA